MPSLFRVHDMVHDRATGFTAYDYRIMYWKTYMPPRHLLAVPQSGTACHAFAIAIQSDLLSVTDYASKAAQVLDFSGAPVDRVIQGLQQPPPTTKPMVILLVAPFHSMNDFGRPVRACLTERDRAFPHLDLDHLGEAMEVGWRDGLSLGIFEVDQACLSSTVSS